MCSRTEPRRAEAGDDWRGGQTRQKALFVDNCGKVPPTDGAHRTEERWDPKHLRFHALSSALCFKKIGFYI